MSRSGRDPQFTQTMDTPALRSIGSSKASGAIGRQYIALGPEIVAAILLTLQSGWEVANIDTDVAAAGETP